MNRSAPVIPAPAKAGVDIAVDALEAFTRTHVWLVPASAATESRTVMLLPTITATHGPGLVPLNVNFPSRPATKEKVNVPIRSRPSQAASPVGAGVGPLPVWAPGIPLPRSPARPR